MSTSSSKHNLAARMAVWSGRHRKKAFWGWLAFVVVVFMAGNMVGTTQISDVDNFSGESHRAEVALDRSGLRPVKESVFIQSNGLTLKDPAFRAAVDDVTGRLSKVPYVENVRSPLTGASAVSADGHAALVDFEIAGDLTQAADRVDQSLAARARPRIRRWTSGSSAAPAPTGRSTRVIGDDLGKAGCSPARHAGHPHHHLRHARRGRPAAVDRDHRRAGRARARRAPRPRAARARGRGDRARPGPWRRPCRSCRPATPHR